ncbi:hypothetical protein [Tepidibacillus marianensis]|uniref:hypothetical protein n=1 Tax=Tepidibacillus marianensis TaxID=3131995 RepID=UPI0030CCE691
MHSLRHISKGMIAALILSVVIALTISFFPNVQLSQLEPDLPVFKNQKQFNLSEKNIVDFISSSSVQLLIKKVTWKQDTLSIDFLIDKNHRMETDDMYRDLYTMTKRGFLQSKNADKILFRVFLNDMDTMFVSISANKKDILKNPTMELSATMTYKEFLDKYFEMNYGNVIKQN